MTRLRAQIPRSASRLLFVCRPRAGRERCPEFRSWETSGDRKYDAHSHPQPSTYRSLDRLLNDVERKIIESGRPNPSLAVLSFGLLQLRCSTTVRCWEPPTSIAAAPAQPWPACGTWPGRSHSAEPGLQCGAAPRHVSVRSTHTSSAHFPGMVQKLDQKLPVANEYLLLSGGVREGVVDLDLDELNVYARGTDYDMDFTLLVPALKLHDRNQPVTLDMRHSALCHSWLSLRLFDEGTISKWKDCCTIVDHINGATNYFFSPTKVADWFYDSISIVLSEIQKKPQRGMPKVEKVEKNGTIISIILGVGSSRMLYDIVPVVSFKGWPAVAQSWLMENHFWDGKITEEEVISGFYLVPACSYKGKKDNEWRLSFARSEVQLKKCISSSLMQAYQACKAIIIKLLSRPKAISPYHLRSMMLWACDRLPANYLAQEDYAAHFLLGLIDDLQHCLVNKMCPNYFIPQCNMLEHLSEETVMLHARKLSSVRSDPAEHLRTAIEHVKAANRLTLELQRRGSTTSIPSPQSDGGDPNQPDDRLAKKLQQLVTENPGKSISVFINPDDVTRPHFRIDDKFF
ncbi:nucleotidyltransferase MB21D2 isoform X1 [Equus przewalskii]|uniref:Nucleotidyltransferase MB21D2 isoform X1 n=1 Tax=Equus przewalskii TaxID=9798 RepID=A0ABM4LDX2_EQUPR